MTIETQWTGNVFGTSTGYVFLRLEGDDANLSGKLHVNEIAFGIVAYDLNGAFDGQCLTFKGTTETQQDGVAYGDLTAEATLNPSGNLEGKWSTTVGSVGTFILYPNRLAKTKPSSELKPEQLYNKRHDFGAIELERVDIHAIADKLQTEFERGQVVVTVAAGTDSARYLEDFREHDFGIERTTGLRLFIQQTEQNGSIKFIKIEFGQIGNFALTQGSDESWVLGALERIKHDLRQYERLYATNVKQFGVSLFSLALFWGAIVVLPDIELIRDRMILIASVFALIGSVNWLHTKMLPYAAIYLGAKPKGLVQRVGASVISWALVIIAGVAEALIVGWLR